MQGHQAGKDDMLTIILIMAVGVLAGYCLRRRQIKRLDNVMTVIIWLLLFLLGVEAGSDERIIKWIGTLGVEALFISVGGVAGSSVLALLLWKFASGKVSREGGCNEG